MKKDREGEDKETSEATWAVLGPRENWRFEVLFVVT